MAEVTPRQVNKIVIDITAMKVEVESSTETLDKVKLTVDAIIDRFPTGEMGMSDSGERMRKVGVR